jgi:acyl-CoA:acyl-CoA alkyltransferase
MRFLYENVCLESIAHTLPGEVITSEEIERRLAPLYSRLRLPEGRLELMSGISERRFWEPGASIGQKSIISGQKAIEQAKIDPAKIGMLVHGSVCRDYLEPATAASVHDGIGLSEDCLVYDLSNACLGLLNGIVQVAGMIELGQIEAGLVVGTECSRSLVEMTIDQLNGDLDLTRKTVKGAIASLTIGSGSAAILLTDRRISRTGNRLLGGVALAASEHCHLCESDGLQTIMETDSEQLLHAGIGAAQKAFGQFCQTLDWTPEQMDRAFCHQVGRAHRGLMLKSLGIAEDRDFTTFPWLGNTGSVALPMTASVGIEENILNPSDRVALLGIGSGINVLMLGLEWGNG